MDRIKPLFTAIAIAVGGRKGRAETSDRIVGADLSVPPEHLFAAGYAALAS
jgi:organic hydroperoxide reductase OsmC/OhrA